MSMAWIFFSVTNRSRLVMPAPTAASVIARSGDSSRIQITLIASDCPMKMTSAVSRFFVSETETAQLMMNTSMLSKDLGTVLVGKDAVEQGLVQEVGGVSKALEKLKSLIL